MKNRALAFGLVVALWLGCAGVAKAEGSQDLAAGTGTLVCCGQPMIHINAQSQPGGVSPQGHFWIRFPSGVEFGGRVVCLAVLANAAAVAGRIDQVKVGNPTQGFVAGNFMMIRVLDNGSPGTADGVNFDPGTSSRPPDCPVRPDALKTQQGNYVVHDDLLDLSTLNTLLMGFEAEANDPYGMTG